MATVPDAPKLARDPGRTRERLLDAAEALILDHGYGATTVEAVVARAGATKGAFFHHFASKAALAHALIERFAAQDRQMLEETFARAERLASDPLQQLLTFVGLYEEMFEALDAPYPGCLFASYIYENKLFDAEILAILRESTLLWRRMFRGKLDEIVKRHPPRREVDLDTVADLFYSITEGALIMTKTLGDKTLAARQVRQYRVFLEVLFDPA